MQISVLELKNVTIERAVDTAVGIEISTEDAAQLHATVIRTVNQVRKPSKLKKRF